MNIQGVYQEIADEVATEAAITRGKGYSVFEAFEQAKISVLEHKLNNIDLDLEINIGKHRSLEEQVLVLTAIIKFLITGSGPRG